MKITYQQPDIDEKNMKYMMKKGGGDLFMRILQMPKNLHIIENSRDSNEKKGERFMKTDKPNGLATTIRRLRKEKRKKI